MHPINKRNFGSLGISVRFTDAGAVTNGTILKQVGTARFSVTDAAGTTAVVKLAQNLADAGTLPAGTCTIYVTSPGASGGTEHVRSIYSTTLRTVEGNRYSWTLVEGTGGNSGTIVVQNIIT